MSAVTSVAGVELVDASAAGNGGANDAGPAPLTVAAIPASGDMSSEHGAVQAAPGDEEVKVDVTRLTMGDADIEVRSGRCVAVCCVWGWRGIFGHATAGWR